MQILRSCECLSWELSPDLRPDPQHLPAVDTHMCLHLHICTLALAHSLPLFSHSSIHSVNVYRVLSLARYHIMFQENLEKQSNSWGPKAPGILGGQLGKKMLSKSKQIATNPSFAQ